MRPYDDLLDYWFGSPDLSVPPAADRMKFWFGADAETDRHIRETFGSRVLQAMDGQLSDWRQTTEGLVATVILLDQFTRNIFRGSGQSYAADPLARTLAATLVDTAADRTVAPLVRAFIYLPFEHSEALADQDRSVALFTALAAELASTGKAALGASLLDYATKHRAIIARFGRFPHRNAELGRTSTPAEVEHLALHGRGF